MRNLPKDGWTYIQQVDTQAIGEIARCNVCNKITRYKHLISHPSIGVIGVGCKCADKLLGNNMATSKERIVRAIDGNCALVHSPKWKHHEHKHEILHKGYLIRIEGKDDRFSLRLSFEEIDGFFAKRKEIDTKIVFSSFERAVGFANACINNNYYR